MDYYYFDLCNCIFSEAYHLDIMNYRLASLLLLLCTIFSNSNFANAQIRRDSVHNVVIFNYVEKMPTPTFDLPQYLSKNLHYPTDAEEADISGRTVIKFVIDESGSVLDPQVVSSPDSSLSAEALRVVRRMPKWNPGMQNGQAVRVYYTLPIVFSIDEGRVRKRKR